MKLDKFVQTLPVAIAVQSGQLPATVDLRQHGQATGLHIEGSVPTRATATDEDVLVEPTKINVTEVTIELDLADSAKDWEKDYGRRYVHLVEKEARDAISGAELKELDRLQKVRRRLVDPPSTEEILARHRREKLDRELLKALQRYVRFQPLPKNKS